MLAGSPRTIRLLPLRAKMSLPPSHRRRRAVPRAALFALLVGARAAGAQDRAVTTLTANLRSGPSRGSSRKGTVPAGDTVTLLPDGHRADYYRVSLRGDRTGWITEGALRILEPNRPAVPPGPFDGCPAEGTVSLRAARRHELEALNRLKNRSITPTDADLDSTVTLARLLGNGSDDTGRFDTGRAAEVTGYVLHVKPGGEHETGNCRHGDPIHRDTHIELTLSPADTLEVRRVIVEVTPRWRAAMHDAGVDWLTETLQQTVEHKWVRVRGWLLFDEEHRSEAENTHPGGRSNWRGTVWEIHPVTGLKLVQHP
jgi:SH3 domain-containing protein